MNLKRVRWDMSAEPARLLMTQEPYLDGEVLRIVRYTYPERGAPVLEFDRPATPDEAKGHEESRARNAAAAELRDSAFVQKIRSGDPDAQVTAMVATGRLGVDVAKAGGWEPPMDKAPVLSRERPAARTAPAVSEQR